jgi:hypothetical protein
MTELELYRFVKNNNIEWHYTEDCYENLDVIIFLYYFQLEDFTTMIKSYLTDSEAIGHLRDGYIGIEMSGICYHYGIELERVFIEDEES